MPIEFRYGGPGSKCSPQDGPVEPCALHHGSDLHGRAGATVDKLALFHYVTRSKEDFAIKMARKGGNRGPKTWHFFQMIEGYAGSFRPVQWHHHANDGCCGCKWLQLSTCVSLLQISDFERPDLLGTIACCGSMLHRKPVLTCSSLSSCHRARAPQFIQTRPCCDRPKCGSEQMVSSTRKWERSHDTGSHCKPD
jgi:hypothetical protein